MSTHMPRFEIFSNGQYIGWSDLEYGDPPMGVAFGVFVPGPGYSSIQEQVRASTQQDQRHFNFTVRMVGGEDIRASGAAIADDSADCGTDAIELVVLGIEYPDYGEIFPEHVERYERQFDV
ncbi:hypothetical protein RZO07_19140 [Pseudomonas protegens]|uniref:hypothetical protein n=1 Tax=Pseudomonas protegens TaxID=380021 RepID=UPI0029373F49|nr:hypothetical protein [Pseudomonas protegens]WOE77433.1 hypothetical protein RZO07_19140 [Pseudomonas protegens]